MGKLAPCPGQCGVSLDYDAVPGYSSKRAASGKFCTNCGHPLDAKTCAADYLEYGPGSEHVMSSRMDAVKAYHAERGTNPEDGKPAAAAKDAKTDKTDK